MKKVIPIFLILSAFFSCKQSTAPEKAFRPLLANRIAIRRNIVYGSLDTEKQTLDVYLQGRHTGEPNWFVRSDTPRPTLIHIHGGAWLVGDKGGDVMIFLPYLERGWNVVNVNYRLGENTAPQAVDDIMCALQWVSQNAEEYRIDTDAIVLAGLSAGGHLALISGLLNSVPQSHPCAVGNSLHIRAIINWFGISDIAALEVHLSKLPLDANYVEKWIGDRAKIQRISELYSPINHITPDAPPILTIHGTTDLVVPFEQSVRLHKVLDIVKIKNQLIPLENRNHGGFTDEETIYAFDEVFKFLAELGLN